MIEYDIGEPPIFKISHPAGLKESDPRLARIEAYCQVIGCGIIIRRTKGDYSHFGQKYGMPQVRLRPAASGHHVQRLCWGH